MSLATKGRATTQDVASQAGLDHLAIDAHYGRVEPGHSSGGAPGTTVGLDHDPGGAQSPFVEPGQGGADTHRSGAGLDGADGGDQRSREAQDAPVAAVRPTAFERQLSRDAHSRSALDGDGGGQRRDDIQAAHVAAVPEDFERQTRADAHTLRALDGDGGGQSAPDAQCFRAAVVPEDPEPGHSASDDHGTSAGLADARLLIVADTFDDLERARVAAENRLRSMRQVKGLDGSPEYARLAGLVEALAALEHRAELELKRALRLHPLGAWVRQTVGVGEKQGARLLAAIGDPAWNAAEDRPRRGPAELWAYCGYVPGQRRRRGERGNWNAAAKMRAYLIAESCIKQARSPYRAVYDAARAKHAEATHDDPCVRCGPAGKPALAGSPLSDGHKHARALREVAKAVLRDLWRAAMEVAQPKLEPPPAA